MDHTSDKANRIKALEGGKGISSLLNEAYEILGNPILMHDMEYKIIAYNEDVTTDDPIWNEYAAKGTVGPEWLDFFKNECFLETAANTKRITFLTSDQLKYNRIFGKLFNRNNIQIGCAVMTACNNPFKQDDPILFELACEIFSRELGSNDFFNEYGQAYLEKLICELVNGIDDRGLYTAHVESIYMHLKANLYLAVVEVGECDRGDMRLAHFRDLFQEAQPEYIYAIYSNYILVIIDTDESTLSVDQDLYPLNQLFHKHNLYAGISRCFENLFELQKHYQEALAVLNPSREIPSRRIFLHQS